MNTATTERPLGPGMPDPTLRNAFYYGKLMDAYHFELETNYLNAKRWLLNRLVVGSGVVCGLDVHGHGDGHLSLSPGVAIDRCGREIVVAEKTDAIRVPRDLIHAAAEEHRRGSRREPCCVHLVICYLECQVNPSPVLSGPCGCEPPCAPGAIRERFCLEFRPGCAPEIPAICRLPGIANHEVSNRELAEWVTRRRRCLRVPRDCCIPLANIPVDTDAHECRCEHDHIDIGIRPVVYYNGLLFEMLCCMSDSDSIESVEDES